MRIKNILLVIAGIACLCASGIQLPVLDKKADQYFDDAITKAGTSYAACRLINGGVSVLKDSDIEIVPLGFGMSVSAGQILDPLDDMTERTSDILVTSIVSLGVQKLVHAVMLQLAPILVGLFLIIWVLLGFKENATANRTRQLLIRMIVVVSVARFCLPLSALVSEGLYDVVFEEQILSAKHSLPFQNGEINKLTNPDFPESNFWNFAGNTADFVEGKFTYFHGLLVSIYEDTTNIIGNLLSLAYLYVGIFVIQVILMPLLMFLLLSKLINTLFNTNIPVVLSHNKN
jgi:hypothetical protein